MLDSLLLTSLSVLRDEFGSVPEGAALLTIDVGLAGLGGVLSLSVRHAEQVIRVDSAVGATVARNRRLNGLALRGLLHVEEDPLGVLAALSGLASGLGVTLVGEEFLLVGLELALLDHAPVIQDESLRGTSSWGNTFLGRDHHSQPSQTVPSTSTPSHLLHRDTDQGPHHIWFE